MNRKIDDVLFNTSSTLNNVSDNRENIWTIRECSNWTKFYRNSENNRRVLRCEWISIRSLWRNEKYKVELYCKSKTRSFEISNRSFDKKNESLSTFASRVTNIFCQLKFVLYSIKIFSRNAEFISINETINKTSSTFSSVSVVKDFHNNCSVLTLTSFEKTFDTMCCLSDLCLISKLNRCR